MFRIPFAIKAALPKGNAALLSEYQKDLRPISEALAVSVHLAEVRVSDLQVSDLQVSVHPALGRLAWVLVCRVSVSVRVLVYRASVSVRALVCRASVRVWGRVLVCRVSVPVWGRGDVSDQRGHCLPEGFRPWLLRLRKAQ